MPCTSVELFSAGRTYKGLASPPSFFGALLTAIDVKTLLLVVIG
jgi:hypothetical protein